jgi:ferredoxin-NADP reductase/ferredoxin
MSYAITLTTHDNQQIDFTCEPEQTVQEAAEEAGFFLPALCKVGSCGSCLGRCTEGDYHLDRYSPSLLPENAREHGDILVCRTHPHSDLHITAPYNASQIQSAENALRDAEIISVELIAERTTRLVLQLLPDSEHSIAFEFEPGQFVELEVPELDLKRAYSIANTPNWAGRLDFLIRLQPLGQFSTYLQETAKAGQRIQVSAASGTFGVQEQSLAPRCFVAGGTGLAPFLSILQRMADWGEDHPTQLFLGVNNEQEIFCQDELAALEQAIPQLNIEICVWKPSATWTGFCGTPADALRAYLANAEVLPDVFLCGPPLLVEAATRIAVVDAGINPERIFCERFA